MNFDKNIIEKSTILRVLVGSTAHGISIGNDDTDHMGVCIEPMDYVMGFPEGKSMINRFEQLIYRTAAEREGKHNAQSKPGDLDLTIYSLRKYIMLAINGNPTILMPLFDKNPIYISDLGKELQNLAPKIISKRAGRAFLGYLTAQKERMLGERGGAHGYLDKKDFKYAAHMIRLGMQGVELLQTGKLTLPMSQPNQDHVKKVRRGEIPMEDSLFFAGELEKEIKSLLDISSVRDEPDTEFVEKWMIDAYWRVWRSDFGTGLSADLKKESLFSEGRILPDGWL